MSTLINKLIRLVNRTHGRKSVPLSWCEGDHKMTCTPLDKL